jgi:enolase
MSTISAIRAREILDSRGIPTVECDVRLSDGTTGTAAVPSGASTGRHEALELRDRDSPRYRGLGVRQAVQNVNDVLSAVVLRLDATDQRDIDRRLLDADGTPQKSHLGANAVLAVSLAVSRAAAASRGVPLYRHIAHLTGVDEPTLPRPMINLISGGAHARGGVSIQDVLLIPTAAHSFSEALEVVWEAYRRVEDRILTAGYPPLVADEGGWAPPLRDSTEAIEWVADALGGLPGNPRPALDVAASEFFQPPDTYTLDGVRLDGSAMIERLVEWVDRLDICSIEDGLEQDDWAGWTNLTERLGTRCQILGDDLFATRPDRIGYGIRESAGNAVLIKPNQIGTLTETLDAITTAKAGGFGVVVSARSGETEDPYVADLAVGSAAGQLKVGSVSRSSRLSKWNRVLRIQEELGRDAYAVLPAPPRSNSADETHA